jgi:carbon-monoxide dehydrogenase small subunit
MNIDFTLNGEKVSARAEANSRLVEVLRSRFKLLGVREGCLYGYCGACTIFFNGKIVPSCLIPAVMAEGAEIVTIEGFSKTVEYEDIVQGFAQAGVKTCGFCDNAKILAAEAFLSQPQDDAVSAFDGVFCRCTDLALLTKGLLAAREIRQRRLYGRPARSV